MPQDAKQWRSEKIVCSCCPHAHGGWDFCRWKLVGCVCGTHGRSALHKLRAHIIRLYRKPDSLCTHNYDLYWLTRTCDNWALIECHIERYGFEAFFTPVCQLKCVWLWNTNGGQDATNAILEAAIMYMRFVDELKCDFPSLALHRRFPRTVPFYCFQWASTRTQPEILVRKCT